jgi:hypothetical protein
MLEAPVARRPSGLGRAATTTRSKRFGHALLEARDRELSVSRLTATVLGDGRDSRAEPRSQDVLLLVAQRLRRVDVEHRLDPRGGDVGVLASRARRAAGSQLDLGLRDLDQVP